MAASLVLGAIGTGPVQADSSQTKKQLDAAIASLNSLEDQIAAENDTIDGMQKDLTDLATQIDHIQSRLANTQFKILQKEDEIQQAQDQYDATRAQLDQRAWVAYETGPGSNLEFLLGSTSLSDLADRLAIVNSAAESDQTLIVQIQEAQNVLRAKQADLESLQTTLNQDNAQLQSQQKAVQKKLDAEKVVLDKLQSDQDAANQLVSDLRTKYNDQKAAEAAARKLLEQQQQQENGDFKAYDAFQVCPVVGAAYSDDFGAPRYGGGYHPHAGNDLLAPRDTEIHAPFAGLVTDASNDLGGIAVEVTGDLGYAYNAHLDHIADGVLGTTVAAGTVIGYVGDSGDAQGGPTHDHFEWHPNDPSKWPTWKSPYGFTQIGDAIDPYPFLRFICG